IVTRSGRPRFLSRALFVMLKQYGILRELRRGTGGHPAVFLRASAGAGSGRVIRSVPPQADALSAEPGPARGGRRRNRPGSFSGFVPALEPGQIAQQPASLAVPGGPQPGPQTTRASQKIRRTTGNAARRFRGPVSQSRRSGCREPAILAFAQGPARAPGSGPPLPDATR